MTGDIIEARFKRTVELAVSKLREAERCADSQCFEAACVMVGAAVESALITHVYIFEREVRAENLWRMRQNRKTSDTEDKPLLDWTLEDLIHVAVKMGWLPTAGGGITAAEPVEKLSGEVGDAVRFIQEVRNLVAHPGKYVRGDYWPTIGRPEYDVVYGIARAVLDRLYTALQTM